MTAKQKSKAIYADKSTSPSTNLSATTQLALSPRMQRPILPAALLLAIGASALTIDLPLSRWVTTAAFPGFIRKLVEMGESFGHGLGVLLIVAAAYHFDPVRRWALPRLMVVTYCGGLAANLTKFLVVRIRPRGFDLASHDVWQTFLSWLPPWQRASVNESFPSAHTATAVAFAMALACLYPQARRFVFGLAALVGVQRVVSGAHYLSDVCCGAAVGWIAAVGLLRLPGSNAWFERLQGEGRDSLAERGAPSLLRPETGTPTQDKASAA